MTCRKGIVSDDQVPRLFGAFFVAEAMVSPLVCPKCRFKFLSRECLLKLKTCRSAELCWILSALFRWPCVEQASPELPTMFLISGRRCTSPACQSQGFAFGFLMPVERSCYYCTCEEITHESLKESDCRREIEATISRSMFTLHGRSPGGNIMLYSSHGHELKWKRC